jgi:flagellar protein FlaG
MQITPDSISYSVNPTFKKPPAEPKLEMVKDEDNKFEKASTEVKKILDTSSFKAQTDEENAKPDIKNLQEVTEALNSISRNYFRRYSFDVVEEANNRVAVTISDVLSGEKIKQIPSEEFVKLMSRVNEFVGMLIDEKV